MNYFLESNSIIVFQKKANNVYATYITNERTGKI